VGVSGSAGFSGLISIFDLFDPERTPPSARTTTAGARLRSPDRIRLATTWGAGFQDENTARYAEVRDLANSTVDETELISYIAEMEALLADQLVIIPLYQRLDPGAVWADTIAATSTTLVAATTPGTARSGTGWISANHLPTSGDAEGPPRRALRLCPGPGPAPTRGGPGARRRAGPSPGRPGRWVYWLLV